ncbi:MAG TPA: transketolase C-terminal domain-containing protein [Anaerolineales bacterium]|nr:transketolase C-terminal domain-containing protein [Anaerolineales bacterium]
MTTVLDSLNHALHAAMQAHPGVYLLGEDLLDPYGGAFKVARGLSTAFPNRVLSSPISEAGLVGLASGMALRGLRPVVEIMFGDFLTLAADQLINHAAKFRWMYNDQVRVPLVVRTPMGGRRGYGPTHSQSLEKHFLGTPGLRVLAPCDLGNPGMLLQQAILEDDDPVLFIENKLLYLCRIPKTADLADFELRTLLLESASAPGLDQQAYAPAYELNIRSAPPARLTIAAYGYMAHLARQAQYKLAYEHEIFAELIILTQLAPFTPGPVLDSVQRTGRLLTVEEGTLPLGWSAEIIAETAAALGSRLLASRRLAALNSPIPASGPLESETLPDITTIIRAAQSMV